MNWYDRINGTTPQAVETPKAPGYPGVTFANPMMQMNAMQQAMMNPAAFVRQALPQIPAEIANDPNRILSYMKQYCGLTDADIQAAAARIPHF